MAQEGTRGAAEGAATPNIYRYHDYRAFLKDIIAWKQAGNPGFSLRMFSRRAGFEAINFIGLVIRGKRNLGLASVRKVGKALELKKDELEYFENMIQMNQAETNEEKNYFYRRMSASKKYLEVHGLQRDQYEFYSKWYYTVIREMVGLPSFREDAAWIARRVRPAISPEEAKATLALLIRLGLVERGPDGRLRQVNAHLSTPAEVGHLGVVNFHHEMIDRAKEAIELSNPLHRDISALTLALTPEKFRIAKERITAFRRELHALLASSAEDAGHAIFQINFQLFNLTEVEHA